jgi:hypothetical protein
VAVLPAASAPTQQPRCSARGSGGARRHACSDGNTAAHGTCNRRRRHCGPALCHISIPDDEPMLDDVEVTEEASALESELVHLGMALSPSSNPARVAEFSSAHHGTAVAPAAAAPRLTASGPPHSAAAPPGASTGGGNAARVASLQAQWESPNAAMKASLAGDDKAAVKTAFDSMKVIKGQIDAINSGGGVAAPAVTSDAPRAASTTATGTVVSRAAPACVPARARHRSQSRHLGRSLQQRRLTALHPLLWRRWATLQALYRCRCQTLTTSCERRRR